MAEREEAPQPVSSGLKNFISGGVGGMCLVVAGHPLDLIKVRLQTSQEYTGLIDCAKKTVVRDGVKGLYRGMLPPLVGVTPIFAVVFWGYAQGQSLTRWFYGQGTGDTLSLGQIVWAGGFSALPATLLMAPAERIKVLLQVQGTSGSVVYKGPWDIASKLGIRGLYRGTAATLLRDVPGSMAYFGAYEGIKRLLTPAGSSPHDLSTGAVFMAGGMAGMANWAIAIPPDVLKSRLQSAPDGKYSGLMDVFVKTVKTEGAKALFRGLGPAMARAFPANAACFLGVEISMRLLNTLW